MVFKKFLSLILVLTIIALFTLTSVFEGFAPGNPSNQARASPDSVFENDLVLTAGVANNEVVSQDITMVFKQVFGNINIQKNNEVVSQDPENVAIFPLIVLLLFCIVTFVINSFQVSGFNYIPSNNTSIFLAAPGI